MEDELLVNAEPQRLTTPTASLQRWRSAKPFCNVLFSYTAVVFCFDSPTCYISISVSFSLTFSSFIPFLRHSLLFPGAEVGTPSPQTVLKRGSGRHHFRSNSLQHSSDARARHLHQVAFCYHGQVAETDQSQPGNLASSVLALWPTQTGKFVGLESVRRISTAPACRSSRSVLKFAVCRM